jgi:predicted O-methyltransferase YrrM
MARNGNIKKPEEIIGALYEGILAREPDDAGLITWTAAFKNGMPLAEIAKTFITSDEFQRLATANLFVPPGHYYSPIVNASEAEHAIAAVEANPSIETLAGIAIDRTRIVSTWHELLPFFSRTAFPQNPTPAFRYAYENPSYSWGDGSVLQAMIRRHRPKRIIEIGSGWSSACTLDTVERYLDEHCALTFIDPHPELLNSFLRDAKDKVRSFECPVQDVALENFLELEADDILFIDSTHVLRTGSDVCYELFEILPRLASGVLVHFHDMFWPFEYPRHWVIDENRSWNEIYAVRAFLTNNDQWEVVMFNDFLAKIERPMIEATWPAFLQNSGGALWLRRR